MGISFIGLYSHPFSISCVSDWIHHRLHFTQISKGIDSHSESIGLKFEVKHPLFYALTELVSQFVIFFFTESELVCMDNFVVRNGSHGIWMLSILSNRFEYNFIRVRIVRNTESYRMVNCNMLYNFCLRTRQWWCDQRVSIIFYVAAFFTTFVRYLFNSFIGYRYYD